MRTIEFELLLLLLLVVVLLLLLVLILLLVVRQKQCVRLARRHFVVVVQYGVKLMRVFV